MKVRFLKLAEAELDDAVEYYNSEQENLGLRFQAEVVRAIDRVMQYPSSYQKISKYSSRRCLVYKFPYGVIYQYQEDKNEILIVAIAHLHRKPDYWYSRDS